MVKKVRPARPAWLQQHKQAYVWAVGAASLSAVIQLALWWQPPQAAPSLEIAAVRTPLEHTQDGLQRSLSVTRLQTNGTTEAPAAGDVYEARLTTTNPTGAAQPVRVQQDVSDLLEYASITDINQAIVAEGVVSWPDETLASQARSVHSYRFRVHDQLSNRAAQASQPTAYDDIISLHYGNTQELHLLVSPSKQLEQTVASLPVVPATTSLVIGFLVIIGAAELYRRAAATKPRNMKDLMVAHYARPGLLIGWALGSVVISLFCYGAAARNGFALHGSEGLIGGLIGLIVAGLIEIGVSAFGKRLA